MRRTDREMPAAFALAVADKCEWAVLGLVEPEGSPYCVPVSIVRDENTIYFHCARAGHKADCMRAHSQVCLACVGDTRRLTGEFTTEYESAILRGTASEVLDESEKIHALRLLCQRHVPANMAHFGAALDQSLSRTAVWKIELAEISGKRKKYDAHGREMKYGRME